MKKSLFLAALLGLLLSGCSYFKKDGEESANEEAQQQEAPVENPAAINLQDQTPAGNIGEGKLSKEQVKKLKVGGADYPKLILPRNAFGIQQIINTMSVKGRANLPEGAKKLLNKKKQYFVVAADNGNSQAALNMVIVALSNCQADSNAIIGIEITGQVQAPAPEQVAELQKKCNTQILPLEAQAQAQ